MHRLRNAPTGYRYEPSNVQRDDSINARKSRGCCCMRISPPRRAVAWAIYPFRLLSTDFSLYFFLFLFFWRWYLIWNGKKRGEIFRVPCAPWNNLIIRKAAAPPKKQNYKSQAWWQSNPIISSRHNGLQAPGSWYICDVPLLKKRSAPAKKKKKTSSELWWYRIPEREILLLLGKSRRSKKYSGIWYSRCHFSWSLHLHGSAIFLRSLRYY